MKFNVVSLITGLFVVASGFAYSQATDGGDAELADDMKVLSAVSNPNFSVLRRMATFRGPYTDQDDPLLKLSLIHISEPTRPY